MGKKIFHLALIALLLTSVVTSCKFINKKNSEVVPEGKYDLYGTIDNSDNIEMEINVDKEGKIEGSYTNKSNDKSYDVQGSVFDQNKITLYVTSGGNTDTLQTFNIFAEKENDDKIVLKGTLSDNQNQKIYNVALSNDKAYTGDLKAPNVAKEDNADKAPQEEESEPEVRPTKEKTVNNSPYPLAPGNYYFEGKAEDRWPIKVYVNVSSSGKISGKMAYNSTLRKYGDKPSHYMEFDGHFSGPKMILNGYFSNGNREDWTLDVSDNGSSYQLDGWAHNHTRDKKFTVNVRGN